MIAKKYSDFKGHIPNRIIEAMFLDVASIDQKEMFLKQVEVGFGPATAFASKAVVDWWDFFLDESESEKQGYNLPKIKNTLLERMFNTVASRPEVEKFNQLVATDEGLATSYVSRIVYGWWKWYLLERGELGDE